MKWLRVIGVACAGMMLISACGVFGDDGEEAGREGDEIVDTTGRITIRAERDSVVVNGSELSSGSFQEAAAGDTVELDGTGSAIITAESVFEIEALRGAAVTIPDVSTGPITIPLDVGHVFVRLDPAANSEVVVDVGDRTFATKSADAEFALCQSPEEASCMAVISGEVEWNEPDGTSVVYGAGEASFAAQGNAPDAPRCASNDDITSMRQTLRSVDFEGALAAIVDTWEECPEGEAPAGDEVAAAVLPSAARMDHVEVEEPVVGSPDVTEDSESVIAERPVDGPLDFYIEPLALTNGEFRAWVVLTAGDDEGAWRRLAPDDWLERAPGGFATQAIYAEGTADESVRGVSYSTAAEYCASQAKRLPREIEWEVAAVNGYLTDVVDEAQDWVSDWESYGPGPEDATDRQVLRGANGVVEADHYFRVFALDTLDATAARQYARIRCAADEVAIGGREFANVIFEDDFNSIDWPQVDDEPIELDYHPENYHLDVSNQHSQLTVVRALEAPLTEGRIDIDTFIERNNTSTGQGNFRFGGVFGTSEQLFTLTAQPDEFAGDMFLACLLPVDPGLADELDLGGDALAPTSPGRIAGVGPNENHYGENCDGADVVEVPVQSVDSPLQLALVITGGELEAWINDVLVGTTGEVSSIGIYGLFNQTYHRQRTHIHFDSLTISS